MDDNQEIKRSRTGTVVTTIVDNHSNSSEVDKEHSI